MKQRERANSEEAHGHASNIAGARLYQKRVERREWMVKHIRTPIPHSYIIFQQISSEGVSQGVLWTFRQYPTSDKITPYAKIAEVGSASFLTGQIPVQSSV